MSDWTAKFDITTIPDDVLLRESARRLRARQLCSPRAKVLRQCPKCGEPFGARELRKHLPRCVKPAVNGMSLNPNRVVRKVTSVEEQEAENYRYPRRGQTRSRVRAYRGRIRDSGARSEC
jgi:hypothetical protein